MKIRIIKLLFATLVLTIGCPAFAQIQNEFQKVIASDGASFDRFGIRIAVHGDLAVIGASPDVTHTDKPGAAYVFTRNENGVWSEQQKLTASDGGNDDYFGFAVALHDETIMVGAYRNFSSFVTAGAVYVFNRDVNGVWSEQQKLTASDGAGGDFFGRSVAIDGDTAIIGADGVNNDQVDPPNDTGAAYVFVRSAGVWTEQQKLLASDGAWRDFLGRSVAIDGDTLVVGAEEDDAPDRSGAAYVFTRSAGVWTEQQKLRASDPEGADFFGVSIAVEGETTLIGAHGADGDATQNSGSAYIFTRSGGIWTEQQILRSSIGGPSGGQFGVSVALGDGIAVIGAPRDTINGGEVTTGSAFVFERNDVGVWLEKRLLAASDREESDSFGASVALTAGLAAVGAHGDDDNGVVSGSGYFFDLSAPVINLVSLPDINSNGFPEIGVAVPGSTRVHIRDGSTDALITDINFGDDVAFDMAVLPDLDASGDPEIAILHQQASGQVRVQARDSVTGGVTSNLWYGLQYEPVSMDVVTDYSGNGFPEVAVLGSEAGTDAVRVQLRDSDTNTFLDNVFLGTQSIASDLVSVTDTSGNGIPEMGILGVLKANDHVRMQMWDADTAAFLGNIWFGQVYQPQSTITMPDINTNGSDEIVAIGVDPATQNVRVQVRDSDTTATLYNIWLGAVNEAVDIALINDINSDGFPDLAVLLKTPAGVGRVRVQSGLNGAFIRNLFYSVVENPVGLAVMPDYSGNGFDELATLGESAGVRHVQILDTNTGSQVNRIDFP